VTNGKLALCGTVGSGNLEKTVVVDGVGPP